MNYELISMSVYDYSYDVLNDNGWIVLDDNGWNMVLLSSFYIYLGLLI